MDKIKRKKQALWFGVVFLVLLGFLFGYWRGSQHTSLQEKIPQYGVVEQNLSIQSVLWKDYPAYRELTFRIEGTILFHTKTNGMIIFNYLEEPDMLNESSRKHLQSYDEVIYNFNNGKVIINIPKIVQDNAIRFITDNSFYLTFHEEDDAYIAGCISVEDTNYVPWTEEEIRNAGVNLDAYLSAFSLSRTYDSTKPLHQKPPKAGITLDKEEGNVLSCILYNNTEQDWQYAQSLPHIELWYKGIWIELNSPFDNNLTLGTLQPSETKRFAPPKETVEQYPTLFPGIYRLVIYGEHDEYIASDPFFYKKERAK